jgi:hypothetical protein
MLTPSFGNANAPAALQTGAMGESPEMLMRRRQQAASVAQSLAPTAQGQGVAGMEDAGRSLMQQLNTAGHQVNQSQGFAASEMAQAPTLTPTIQQQKAQDLSAAAREWIIARAEQEAGKPSKTRQLSEMLNAQGG